MVAASTHNTEDRMGPARLNIHICFGHSAQIGAFADQIHYLLFGCYHALGAANVQFAGTALLYLQLVSFIQEIINFLIINFDVRHSNCCVY